jgi:hypothetical protein
MDLSWWSIEVLDGPDRPARFWRESHGGALIEAAVTNGAYDWNWQAHTWGVLLEIAFRSDERWQAYRASPAVRAALDAVPDPVNGLLVYPGRGGSAGTVRPRRPRPVAGSGGAELPVEPEVVLRAAPAGRPPTGPPPTTAGVV